MGVRLPGNASRFVSSFFTIGKEHPILSRIYFRIKINPAHSLLTIKPMHWFMENGKE
jgi:hypothetical protein